MRTTHISKPTEPNAKSKDGQLLETISLRDYFAAKALMGIMAGRFPIMLDPDAEHKAAKAAYIQADAMLKARDQ